MYFLGSYMYTEASSPRAKRDIARIFSSPYPATTGSCVKFYYHMYGATMGTLNVYARIGNQLGNPVYSLSGNHGNLWDVVEITVKAPSSWQVCTVYSLLLSLIWT